MRPEEDFRAYMKALNRASDRSGQQHLSEAQIIAYCRGEMGEADREAARTHLVDCTQCLSLFRSARDFVDPQHSDEEVISQTETNEAWQSLARRLQFESPRQVNQVVTGDFQRRSVLSRVTLAWAAMLLISFGLLGWQSWRLVRERELRQQTQERMAQLENSRRDLEQRVAQVEQTGKDELEREREKRLNAEAERDQLLARRDTPALVAEYIPVYSFTLSSERGAQDALQLHFTRGVKTVRLRLLISKPYEFERFAVEVADANGKIVQAASGLRPTGDVGALSFKVNRTNLSSGNYRLRLFGGQGQTRQQIGDYAVAVSVD